MHVHSSDIQEGLPCLFYKPSFLSFLCRASRCWRIAPTWTKSRSCGFLRKRPRGPLMAGKEEERGEGRREGHGKDEGKYTNQTPTHTRARDTGILARS